MKLKCIIACLVILSATVFSGCGRTSSLTQNTDSSTGVLKTEETIPISEADGLEASDDENAQASRDLFAMDTYMTITAYGSGCEEAVDAAAEKINQLDEMISIGNENSEIFKVNESGEGVLSPEVGYLVERSSELYDSTGGLFDIAIYPIMEEWGFTTQDYHVPDEDVLNELMTLTDASKIIYDNTTGEISFGSENMQIDLGGITKGYTSAEVMEIYKKYGVKSGLVSLGGNVQLLGSKVDGSPWRVAIQSPDEAQDYIGVLSAEDVAVITSGGYERYFEQDGKTYHHIIDPRTGYPADSGLVSSTIVSKDGTLADGLSTALFIMGTEQAIDYWNHHSDEFDFILMDENKEIYITEGIADQFETDYVTHVIRTDQ